MTETNTPTQEEKKPVPKKLHIVDQNIRHGFERVHKKIGVYGWISLGLFIILMCTIAHYEGGEYHRFSRYSIHPLYIRQDDNWAHDMDRNFENMQRQMDYMRSRNEAIMRDAWNGPIDPKATTTSIVSNGDYQYSVNTKDGKLDGFVSTSDTTRASALLAQIKGLGLTVDQKDSKLFFNGGAQKLNDLLKILGK